MNRREFTRAQKAAMVHRAMNAAGHVVCEGCGGVLKKGRQFYEFDHTIPEALVIDKSRPLTIEDGKLLGKACCHRGEDGKTARDVAQIAKAVRRNHKHIGNRKRSTMAGSSDSKWRKPFNGPAVLR